MPIVVIYHHYIIKSRGDVVVHTVKVCDIAPVDFNTVVLLLLSSPNVDDDDDDDGDHSIASWFKVDRSDAVCSPICN